MDNSPQDDATLKFAIIVYFKKHPTSKWKLTTNERVVTIEMCSLLGHVEGGDTNPGVHGTYISHTDGAENGHHLKEETVMIDLTPQAQQL